MQHNFSSLPFIIGVSLLLLVPIGAGGLIYSFVSSNLEETKDLEPPAAKNSHFEELEVEQNVLVAPTPVDSQGRGTIDSESTGIPIGKYSNPPTTIDSGSSSGTDNSLVDSDGDRPTQQQELVPNYGRPSSSNNLERTPPSDILDPLDEDFVAIPDRDDKKPVTAPPITEPLLRNDRQF
ncbi:hypothetical protein IQ255_21290 [Pleurocapsales cyanobacterium LEGE 10410]|nr:hypothetical protein [Pleurocapsales cyanobacterium LEGE 10410]